jgi:hypothetical protein
MGLSLGSAKMDQKMDGTTVQREMTTVRHEFPHLVQQVQIGSQDNQDWP